MFNPFRVPQYQLYLLQLENYELGRFWKLLFKKGLFPKGPMRKSLVWTAKARVILVLSQTLHLIICALVASSFAAENYIKLILFLLCLWFLFYFYSIFFTVSLVALRPADYILKKLLVTRAASKIKKLSNSKVIGIAGSYGKTTMKEVLSQVLGVRFKVQATPESVNTPVGISRWILKQVNGSTDVLVVEMGEHYQGDIAELCNLTPPDIVVVTGINEAHLERMKTLENIIATIFEIISSAKPGAEVFLNADDQNVMANYNKYVWPDMRVAQYLVSSIKYKVFDPETLQWEAEFDAIGKVKINLLGEYALADVSAAVQIATQLGLTAEEIKKGIGKIKPVEHRLQPIKSQGGLLIIDDAYNGNPDGAKEAIKVLSRFADRRKIYITPGLVETGKDIAKVHREIGKQLAAVADVVLLIKNSVTKFIEEGIKQAPAANNQRRVEVIWFDTAPEAHSSLGKILKPGDVVLFQNDWGDQYL